MVTKELKPSIYIAALGTSAPGLESLQNYLSQLPPEIVNFGFHIPGADDDNFPHDIFKNSICLDDAAVKQNAILHYNKICINAAGAEIMIRENILQVSKLKRKALATPWVKEHLKLKESGEQQQRLFHAISNNFPDGIIGVLDKNLHYVFAGGAEIKNLGLTEQDFIGKNIFSHLSKRKDKSSVAFLKKALKGENVIFEVEMLDRIFKVNAVPLFKNETEDMQILIVLTNITNRKKAEKDLRETLKKEKELGELKSRFVSMASHEFRTPLSTVLSSAYLIEKYTTADEQPKREKHLQRIISSVEMLTEILNDFLNLGKIEEGRIQVRLSHFDINELLNQLIKELKNTLRNEQKIVYRHKGDPMVYLDSSLLKHIVMNLVSNASKFSAEGKTIQIKTINSKLHLSLSVKDHGIGIPAEDRQHLMERFFRGANAGNIQGTGLGLHIVSKYAELLNAVVECRTELEKGTEFIIRFRHLKRIL